MRPLTVKEVAAIRRPGLYRVSRNLYVQVTDTGTKSWLFRYMNAGTSHGMGLGSLELVTLAEARDKALLCRKLLLDGVDPLAERRAKRVQSAAGRGEQDHLSHLCRALHRGARARLAQHQAPPTVAEHP